MNFYYLFFCVGTLTRIIKDDAFNLVINHYAMKDLYKHLEDEIDKFYTLEEKMSYHYETLIELYKLFNSIGLDLKNEKCLSEFLEMYNDLTPNEYRFEKIEIENANKEKTLNYIKFNGLESYKTDNYMKNINESFKRN